MCHDIAVFGQRIAAFLLAGLLGLGSAVVQAGEAAPIPDLHRRVTDTVGLLDAAQTAALEARLTAIQQRKGAQVAVLIVASTQPETIEQYAVRAFEQWKLGRQGIDDGVLLVVARDDRKVRIEVGYGLEGALPDAVAARIIRETSVPRFRAGDFPGGIGAAVETIGKVIDGEALPSKESGSSDDLAWWNPLYLLVGLMLGALPGVLLAVLTRWLPRPVRIVGVSTISGLATGWLLQSPLAGLGAGLVGSLLAAFIGRDRNPRGVPVYPGGSVSRDDDTRWTSSGSDSSSSWSSSDSSSSSSSDFSGGGGSSGGGGASGDW